MLFVRKVDIETNGATAGFVATTVGSLHDARSTASDDAVAIFGEFATKLDGKLAPFVGFWQTGGSKDANALRICLGAGESLF